jgi:cysteine desulfurase family protein
MDTPRSRIYLDHAATSFPKPPGVIEAMQRFVTELGTAPGRGTTRAGAEVQQVIDRCRRQAARLFAVPRPEQVIFTLNGTDSLNQAIHGLLHPGDRVVTTCWEHNSVLRPLWQLQQTQHVTVEVVPDDGTGLTDLQAFAQALQQPARLVILNHASNVTGLIQPVHEMIALAQKAEALVLLDAAQTAGHIPVSFHTLPVDLIATPGHKGLHGPLGTGLLLLSDRAVQQMQPVRQGGTGTSSESAEQPVELPERFESGNLNAPGIFGLEAALAALPTPCAESGELALTRHFLSAVESLPGVQVPAGGADRPRVPVVSLGFERITPHVMANLLDAHYGIETRAGLHCAPRAHAALGTLEQGGTLRFSFGAGTTEQELDQALTALAEILAAM